MKAFGNFLLLILLVLTGIWLYRKYQENKQKQKELKEALVLEQEAIRQELFDFYQSNLESIQSAVNKFVAYLDINTGYFTNAQLTAWRSQYVALFNELKKKPFQSIQLSADEMNVISKFNNYFLDGENTKNDFNKKFVEAELSTYNHFFNNVEGRSLDKQQRTAIVTDEENNLVIAGAGSGKTSTIVGKVHYVIDRYKVSPNEILLISFTNKSASTLAARIGIEGVEAKTFHKFGKDIIAESQGKQPTIFDENQFKPLLVKYFSELTKDQHYLKLLTSYFSKFLKPVKSPFEFESRGDYIQYMKDKSFHSYKIKEVSAKGRTTYRREVVKSMEECEIANFLLFNGIDYEYESPYEHDTSSEKYQQYKPDFTIKQNGRKIYLEHFGVARNGNVPAFFAKDGKTREQAKNDYWEKIYWKKELHKKKGTTLIETFSYEMSESILFDNLTKNLTEAGILLQPKSAEDVWHIIEKAAKDEVTGLITLFGTFIRLMKSNNYSISAIINKNSLIEDDLTRKRNVAFIDLLTPIFERYEKHLADRGEIDFSDMITRATDLISSGKHKRKFSYVIIDEFQDISIGRYQLIKAIKTTNPFCKLFCVGDDWQSIYRFSGSDIALFKEFEKYFGYTVKSKIETTYRFHKPLIDLSSEFILKNPNQEKKELKQASDKKRTDYKIHYSISDNQDDTLVVQKIFNHLLTSDDNIQQKEILILGRYGFDIDRLKNENGIFNIDRKNLTVSYSGKTTKGEARNLKAQFMTIHKSKGLEADIIIILNCNSGERGFPSEISDDPVLNLLLSESDQFENGEERRLFYVAMTRSKEHVYFITDSFSKSKFITELEVESDQIPSRKCPYCKTSDIVLKKTGVAKNGNTYKFYGCANYAYGCDYTTTEWIKVVENRQTG